jgi:SprT protein
MPDASKVEKASEVLKKYVPEDSVPGLIELLYVPKLKFKITRPRKTKFGDYTYDTKTGNHRITINSNLNPYAFLVTALHEIAHYRVRVEYGGNNKPHGKEWQMIFRDLLRDFMLKVNFPEDIRIALLDYLKKPSASSCSDPDLYRALLNYNKVKGVLLEEIPEGSTFVAGNKVFTKGRKRLKRFICLEHKTNKAYLVHGLAEIEVISMPLL